MCHNVPRALLAPAFTAIPARPNAARSSPAAVIHAQNVSSSRGSSRDRGRDAGINCLSRHATTLGQYWKAVINQGAREDYKRWCEMRWNQESIRTDHDYVGEVVRGAKASRIQSMRMVLLSHETMKPNKTRGGKTGRCCQLHLIQLTEAKASSELTSGTDRCRSIGTCSKIGSTRSRAGDR
jgi:hypothetical protein